MSELRRDPLTKQWIVVSSDRGLDPQDYLPFMREPADPVADCPLCPGAAGESSPDIARAVAGNGAWAARVIPHFTPRLRVEEPVRRWGQGLYDLVQGTGAHELVIETPRHDCEPHEQGVEQVRLVLELIHGRLQDLARDERLRHISFVKTRGAAAGAEWTHPHSQILGWPVLPQRLEHEMAGFRDYVRFRDRCLFCDMMSQELDQEQRVVAQRPDMAAFMPYAARFPFETWIAPRRHAATWLEEPAEFTASLASLLVETLGRLDQALNRPAFQMALHTGPVRARSGDLFHWYLALVPRVNRSTGFEWGSGFHLNPTAPEEAAQFLRALSWSAPIEPNRG